MAVVAWLVAIARVLFKLNLVERQVGVVGLSYLAGLGTYYGLFFGAGHFLSRYLFPISALAALASSALLVGLVRRVARPSLARAIAVTAGALVVIQQVRIYVRGARHEHWQLVAWVRDHVPPEVRWCGGLSNASLFSRPLLSVVRY